MPSGYLRLDVPIAALATAPVPAALAVVRTSGPGAPELAAKAFSRPEALAGAESHRIVHGFVRDPETGEDADEVVALVFRAPSGYTGQDAVDFVCHGGTAAREGVLAALGKAGFERALPGEFTFRAFAAGKMDLAAAEAVDELVRARTGEARDDALDRLSGGLGREVSDLRDAVLEALAEVEARLDYGEDELADGPDELAAAVEASRARAEALAASHAVGRILTEGARIALAGPTNAGKSRLFNLFLKEERSIVSESHGTTRDYIEADLDLDGIPVALFDTAGLRNAPDPVEAEGVRRSRLLAEGADLVVYLVDGTRGAFPEDREILDSLPGAVRVWNKVDRPEVLPAPEGWIPLSAATGEGFPALAAELGARLRGSASSSGPRGTELDRGASGNLNETRRASLQRVASRLAPGTELVGVSRNRDEARRASSPQAAPRLARLASRRQAECARRAAEALAAARNALAAGAHLDAAAVDLREAADALAELTGESVPESVLETIFSRFCVGK